jgi:excisionase family DNA binding protein
VGRKRNPEPPRPDVTTAAQLLTTAQVAVRLQVDAKTVRRMIAARELPGYRVGREFRVHPDHLDAYLAGRIVDAQVELLGGAALA